MFSLAVFSTSAVISGDQQGRVNLLYLLLLFVAWPLLSLLLSIVLAASNSKVNSISSLLALPIWPRAWIDALSQLRGNDLQRPWLFCQSQKMSLVFSLGCITAFLFVLLFNDVTFIWRSTLLSAEQVFPVLQLISTPWWLLESAQPMMEQVQASRDSRLQLNDQLSSTASWWRYVFMAQLTYALFPRLLLFVWGARRLKSAIEKVAQQQANSENQIKHMQHLQQQQKPAQNLSRMQYASAFAEPYVLLSWTKLPELLEDKLAQVMGVPEHIYQLTGSCDLQLELQAQRDVRAKLLIVAAWEPPMGELQDFMLQCQGVLMPLDWQCQQFVGVDEMHLDEWRRFCQSQKNWQLQQLKGLV
ncbi:MAG: hypothetical protein OFPI_09320 [Osedax symbiont Rs2]|nr:MAG: hypothetical protein OFPI_09320 [Osedax symbiont Rs2]